MMRPVLAAIITTILVAAPAQAVQVYGQPATDPLAIRSLAIAKDWWDDDRPVEMYYADLSEIARPDGSSIDPAAAGAPGLILLDSQQWGGRSLAPNQFGDLFSMPAWRWCQLVGHEYGHAIKHDHSTGEPTIMTHWYLRGVIPGCMRLGPAIIRAAARWPGPKGQTVRFQRVPR